MTQLDPNIKVDQYCSMHRSHLDAYARALEKGYHIAHDIIKLNRQQEENLKEMQRIQETVDKLEEGTRIIVGNWLIYRDFQSTTVSALRITDALSNLNNQAYGG